MSEDLAKPQHKSSIKAGIIVTYVRLAVYLLISIVYPPYLLRMVGSSDNGLYTFATSVVAFILLLSFGSENSYVRFATVAEKEKGEEGVRKINGFYLVLFAIITLLELIAGVVAAFLFRAGVLGINNSTPELIDRLFALILIVTLSAAIDFFLSLFGWYAYFKSQFVWEQAIILVSHLLTVGLTVLALYTHHDIFWVAWIGLLAQLATDIATMVFALKKLKMRFDFSAPKEWFATLKNVLVFSLWIFLVVLVAQINSNLGKTVLGQMVDPGITVTVFSYGIQFYAYEALMAQGISNNFSPKINDLVVRHQDTEVKSLWLRASKLQMVVLFMVVGGFVSCGLDFITAWLAKNHNELTPENFTQIYILACGFLALWLIPLSETVGVEVQRAYDKHRFLAIFNALCALVSVAITILSVAFLPAEFKIYGPLIGMGVGTFAGMIVAANIYYKKALDLPVGHFIYAFLLMLGITVLAWAVPFVLFTYGIHLPEAMNGYLKVLFKALVFLLVYLPCCALLYHKEIKRELANRRKAKEDKRV